MGRNEPWINDADRINTSIIEEYIYETPVVKKFKDSDDYYLISGTKGTGKTLLLKLKRHKFQTEHRDYLIIPENIELDHPTGVGTFSQSDIKFLSQINVWATLWKISIYSSIIKYHIKSRPDSGLLRDAKNIIEKYPVVYEIIFENAFLNPGEFISAYLQKVGLRGKKEFYGIINSDLLTNMRSLISTYIRSGCAIFIDKTDEFLIEHLIRGTNDRGTDLTFGMLSISVWYAIQGGLILAVREITTQNHHIKIFVGIRKEVIDSYRGQSYQQIQGMTLNIKYDLDDLRRIFIKNILLEDRDNLVEPNSKDPIEGFFGTSKIETLPYVEEDIFMYIYRHTLKRPRDIITIGRRLSELGPEKRKSPKKIREVVNSTAAEIIEREFLNQVYPFIQLQASILESLLAQIPTNILSKDDLEDICENYGLNCWELFYPLYGVGLLGIVSRSRINHEFVQEFLSPNEMKYPQVIIDERSGEPLMHSKEVKDSIFGPVGTYLIHPALDAYLRRRSTSYKPRQEIIVGDSYPYPYPNQRAEFDIPSETPPKPSGSNWVVRLIQRLFGG
ncbi:hypothetical protein CDI07_05410 [Thermococcus sp. 5-4]|nr:hypothetical protein CDI07_05410 [Thermococcus sp. 5-4]